MGSYIILWILFVLYIIITLYMLFKSKSRPIQTQSEKIEIDKEKIYNSLVKLRDLLDITLIGLGNFVLFIIAVLFIICMIGG